MAHDHTSGPAADAVLSALRELVEELLAEPAARQILRRFAAQLLEALGPEDSSVGDSIEICSDDTVTLNLVSPSRPAAPPPVDVVSSAEAVRQLKWAQSADSRLSPDERQAVAERAEAAGEFTGRPITWRTVPNSELSLIPKRCRIKAQACRWKLERRRLLEAGNRFSEGVEPRDAELIAQAKQVPDCFLWMNYHEGPTVGATTAWETLGECFDALADAVAALEESAPHADDFPDLFREILHLVAEAQSALRSAARAVHYEDEQEQDRTYNWLKRTAAERGQYIERHMRVDDPADPTRSADLRRRIAEYMERLEARRALDKQRKKRLGQLKYHAQRIQSDADDDHAYNWDKVLTAVDELVAAGEPPSSKELRKHLLPILDDIPAGDLPPNVELVLREIDRFLAENPEEEPRTAAPRLTPEVQEVARRLAGRSIVLIGGIRKPGHVQALKEAFRLKDVIWVPTREHQSVAKFEPYVRQPDVAVVVLAIRWTSHSYGEVKDFCDAYGKPFVRLKAGYNPVQVATHILEQVSDKLPTGGNAEGSP